MMKTLINKQRGVTMSGFIVTMAIIFLAIFIMIKIVPAYLQDKNIRTKMVEVANDPDLKAATVRDIRTAFTKRASMTDITAITADEIEVVKDGSDITLNASYSVKIPLFGNASVLLEFNPSSAKK